MDIKKWNEFPGSRAMEGWPYTNLHDLNLDWIINTTKEFAAEISRFEDNVASEVAGFEERITVKIGDFEGTIQEYTDKIDAALATVDEKITYIDNFFSSLDVQQEINNKLNSMSADGSLAALLKPFADAYMQQDAPGIISAWLAAHITEPEGVVIDSSLKVAGAAADAKAAGDQIANTEKTIHNIDAFKIDNIMAANDGIIGFEVVGYDATANEYFIPTFTETGIVNSRPSGNRILYYFPIKDGAPNSIRVFVQTTALTLAFTTQELGSQNAIENAYYSENAYYKNFTVTPLTKYVAVRINNLEIIGYPYAYDSSIASDPIEKERWSVKKALTSNSSEHSNFTSNSGIMRFLTVPGAQYTMHGNQQATVEIAYNMLHLFNEPYTWTPDFNVLFKFLSFDIKNILTAGNSIIVESNNETLDFSTLISVGTIRNNIANEVVTYVQSSANARNSVLITPEILSKISSSDPLYLHIGSVMKPPRTNVPQCSIYFKIAVTESFTEGTVYNTFTNNGPIKNKRIAVLSDSIGQGERWQPEVVNALHCNISTYAIGGSTIANNGARVEYQGKTIDSWMCSDDRIEIIDNDPDIILCLGGHNDQGYNIPMGTLGETSLVDTTFYGGYSTLLKKLLAKFPNAQIYMFTCLNSKVANAAYNYDYQLKNALGLSIYDYSEAIRNLSKYYSIPVIDIGSRSGINTMNRNLYTIDTVHPNDRGGELIASVVIHTLENNYRIV